MKMFRMMMVMVLAGALGVSACSGDDPGGSHDSGNNVSDSDTGMDAGDADAAPSADADAGHQDVAEEPDACVPSVTECSADMCGQVDNGCGEMIDCGQCPCEAGVVNEASCGTCGLGVRSCGSDETGFGTCASPELPGVPEDADEATCDQKLVFLKGGAAGGDGSKNAPFGSYADALAAANSGQVIAIGGQTALTEPLTVKKGVSVVGGFDGTFAWTVTERSRFEVPAPQDAPVMGLKAEQIDEDTTIANVEIDTADAAAGKSNYGAYLVDSSAVTLKNVVAKAGSGGRGIDGDDGDNGGDGDNGESTRDVSIVEPGPDSIYFARPQGGTNSSCPVANGGLGGRGWHIAGQAGSYPPSDGESTTGADGGAAGYDYDNHRHGEDGQDGQAVTSAGANGDGGTSGGQVANGLWEPGGAGIDGQRGENGHGGGGGGGAYTDDTAVAAPPGGGGGAGGCGGQPGKGGQPGGGSFGLLLIRSDAKLIDSEFRAGLGGVGGSGGSGGLGGRGGFGGDGSDRAMVPETYPNQGYREGTVPWVSGNGGDGSDGREGGAGGGGAGGVSYGVYCVQSRPDQSGNVKLLSGGSARGGQSPGNAGGDGVSQDEFGCQ